MLIGVPAETTLGETRVAVTPETAKKLKAQGHVVRIQSGAGVAASAVLGLGDSKLSLGGMVMGAPSVIGISVAGASLASSLSHDFILAKIKPNASLADFEARALAPALTAAATIAAAYATIGPISDVRAALELGALGAGSEIGGTYAHSMVMSLMRDNNPVHAI